MSQKNPPRETIHTTIVGYNSYIKPQMWKRALDKTNKENIKNKKTSNKEEGLLDKHIYFNIKSKQSQLSTVQNAI